MKTSPGAPTLLCRRSSVPKGHNVFDIFTVNLQNELHIKIHTTARFPAFVASGVGEPATFAMIGTIQML